MKSNSDNLTEALPLNCPQCGTGLTYELPAGLCPKCLLDSGLSSDDLSVSSAGIDPDVTRELQTDPETLQKANANTTHLSAGDTFGDYELLDEIARGGMGVVFRARDRKLGRVVALKMILSGQLASADDVERFRREAEAAASLDHPGIVPIYEIGEHAGQHFFSMKLVEGGSLAERLPVIRRDTGAAVELIEKVARAVHYAHQRGILHRDLKPANILLDEQGQPLVTDLGLAKRIESDSNLTNSGAIVGTPTYMPPEQAAASKDITTSADIYSIGAILYEALTGRTPHTAESPFEMLMKVLKEDIASPRSWDRKIDRSLELICLKCLQRDPNDRYSSAGALADDLGNWLAGRPVSVKPPSVASVVSSVFVYNLRSALGAAAIGAVAGLVLGLGVLFNGASNNFGPGGRNDLAALYSALPSMEQTDLWFANVPESIYGPIKLSAPLALLLIGLVVQLLVRPQNTQQALAVALVAGLLMTISVFACSFGIISTWATLDGTLTEDISQISRACLAEGADREAAVDWIMQDSPDLAGYSPERRADLLGKRFSTDLNMAVPRGIWTGLLISAVMCLMPCVGGTLHAFRLHRRDQRIHRIIVPYVEVVTLLLILTAYTLLLACLAFGIGTAGNEEAAFKLLQWPVVVTVFSIAVATIPGIRLWGWRGRWGVYAALFGTLYVVFQVLFA